MSSNNGDGCFIVIAIIGVCFICTLATGNAYMNGHNKAMQEVREEAVENGHAKWTPQKDGTTVFEWVPTSNGRTTEWK